jgi:antitoxin component HigA of HigAB toxin-antitoxin module
MQPSQSPVGINSSAMMADYLALALKHPLMAIDDDEAHARAIEVLNEIIDLRKPTSGQEAYMDALGDLVHSYESRIYTHTRTPAGEYLKSLIEFKGVTQTEVHEATGVAHSTISEILSGLRKPSRKVIAAFSVYFKVGSGYFID